MPVILVLLGLGLLQIPWIVDSPAFYLTTDAYPGPQRITMNNDNYVETTDQFTPQQLGEGLPDYDGGYWEIDYYTNSTNATDYSYAAFYQYVN